MIAPGPFYRCPPAYLRVRDTAPSSFRVLETFLTYAQTLDEARRVNRKLVTLWDRAEARS